MKLLDEVSGHNCELLSALYTCIYNWSNKYMYGSYDIHMREKKTRIINVHSLTALDTCIC